MKTLLTALLLIASARMACAAYQWDICYETVGEIGGLDSLECWDPQTCTPVLGKAYMHNMIEPEDLFEGSAVITTDGTSLYSFVVDIDEHVPDPPGILIVDSIMVELDGLPLFWYHWVEAFDPDTEFYLPGIPVPPDQCEHVGYGNGCVCYWPEPDWTWENYPEGVVNVTEDFTVEDDDTLYIEAGIDVYATEGVAIIIEGEILADGTSDAWITFEGDAWEGIHVTGTGEGELYYTRITGVEAEGDGGALTIDNGGYLRMWNCLVDHNTTAGLGGAACVHEGGSLLMRSCTVSDNLASSGGNIYAAGSVGGLYNLVTFGLPENMVGTNPDQPFGGLQWSCLFPLDPDSVNTGWYCDPGYLDPDAADYHISFWNPDTPEEVNCVIDVAFLPGDLDPDGTLKDMGAFPFDQYDVLQPAELLAVYDIPEDQGGQVLLEFLASPNDGSLINPISFYSIWTQYPESEDWISSGQMVGALNDPEMVYTVAAPTSADSMEGDGNLHVYWICAHNSMNPLLTAFSNELEGWSVDNIAPTPVTGFEYGDWYYDEWPPNMDMLDLSWDANPANDFAYYMAWWSQTEEFEDAELFYEGLDNQATLSVPYGILEPDYWVCFWLFAVDVHQNASEAVMECVWSWVGEAVQPLRTALGPNHPNPFNPATRIDYSIAQPGEASLWPSWWKGISQPGITRPSSMRADWPAASTSTACGRAVSSPKGKCCWSSKLFPWSGAGCPGYPSPERTRLLLECAPGQRTLSTSRS